MLHPSYKEMYEHMNSTKSEQDKEMTSRYTLVLAAAKRARQIGLGSKPLVEAEPTEKPLSVAVREMANGDVHVLQEEFRTVTEEDIKKAEDPEEAKASVENEA